MPALIFVMSDYDMLSDDDQEKFKRIVLGRVVKPTTLNDAAADLRFKNGLVCPKCGCVHVVRNGHDRKGIYHIQYVTSCHRRLDEFLDGFHMVSTKYLNNYLVWNNVCNYCKGDDVRKGDMVLSHILTCPLSIRCRKVVDRPAIPALVA